MFDASIRPLIDRPLNAAAALIAARGISANSVTLAGLLVGLLAAAAVASQEYQLAFGLIVANRVLDGLDGAVARAATSSDRGGYLDIVADYVFYASVPLAFAIAAPTSNALPAAALLAGFCLTGVGFLAFASIAARRGLHSEAHGRKAFFYSTGIVEGAETIGFFLLMTALPGYFAPLAWLFAALCVLTAVQRTALAMAQFRD